MGINIDKTFIQSRMLNTGKGPAVYSLRVQADKVKYSMEMKKTIENTDNLLLRQDEVIEILIENGEVYGVKTISGGIYKAKAVVLATGTYLNSFTASIFSLPNIILHLATAGSLSSIYLKLSSLTYTIELRTHLLLSASPPRFLPAAQCHPQRGILQQTKLLHLTSTLHLHSSSSSSSSSSFNILIFPSKVGLDG